MSNDQEARRRAAVPALPNGRTDRRFFAEYPVATGEPNTIDTDEVITAVAKTVAELTSSQDGAVRQNMIEQLKREIINFDAEFRQQDAMGVPSSEARH